MTTGLEKIINEGWGEQGGAGTARREPPPASEAGNHHPSSLYQQPDNPGAKCSIPHTHLWTKSGVTISLKKPITERENFSAFLKRSKIAAREPVSEKKYEGSSGGYLFEQDVSITRRTDMKPHTTETIIYARAENSENINDQLRECLRFCEERLGYNWIDERHVKRALTDTWRTGTGAGRGTVLAARARSSNSAIRIERDWARQQQQHGRRRTLDAINRINTEMNRTVNVVAPAVNAIARNRAHINDILELLNAGNVMHVVEGGFTLNAATDRTEDILELAAGLYTTRERPHPGKTSTSSGKVELEFADPDAPTPDGMQPTGGTNQNNDQATLLSGIKFPVRIPYSGGRPPLGFDIEGDELVSNDRYVTINTVVQKFRDGDLTKTEAAEKLDCSRATIENLSDRTELYQLV